MLIITGVKYKYWTFELTSKFYLFVYSATTIFQILIRFFQRIFSSLFNKFWLFYSNYPLIYIGILYFLSCIFIYLLFLEQMISNLILSHYDVIWLSNLAIIGDTKSIKISPYKSIKQIKYKYNFIKVTVPFNELTDIKFIQILMLNLKLHSLNTIMFQYNEYSTSIHLMLGSQVGIVVKDRHDISYYRKLFAFYVDKLEIQMSFYTVGLPDFITIYLKEIQVDETIRIGDLSQIVLPKRLINVSETKTKFNSHILPLTLVEKYFGSLLEENIKFDYLNKLKTNLLNNKLLLNQSDNNNNLLQNFSEGINNTAVSLNDEKKQIAFLNEVIESDKYKVYLSNNKLYLIISYLTQNFEYNRVVFNINTGKFLFCSKDSFNKDKLIFLAKDTSNYFVREIGNLSVVLNKDNNIELFIKEIDLPSIKYREHNKFINPDSNLHNLKLSKPIPMRNPKFGVFDVETFNDTTSDGEIYSRIYALGFCIYMDKPSMFYLTDYFDNTLVSSHKLVLKCIDAMLIPEYNKYIFYVHNFGKFDAIFLHKILLDYNLSALPENQYKLIPLYRDNKIIKLDVIKYIKSKKIKITFVDSLNILNDSLDKLCKDFGVINKGIFPYKFVNKDNLDYIGIRPDISYYNKNVSIELYNEINVYGWSLKIETLKYLETDLISLLEVLAKFQEFLWIDHNIELTESLTISGLAKTKFMKYYIKDSKIPLINTNNLFQFINSSYYGGITEVYKPHGKNLTYTDVNSLYPYAALNPMPGINCQWLESYNSEGLDLSKLFGVFYAKVITNEQYLGLLPVRTKSGIIFPRGKFDGIWTSVELEMAKANGYQITVIKGLHFNKQNSPFKEYVEELSKKKDMLKGSSRQVVKSLLNNLIGRFALNFVKPITKTVNQNELDYLLATKEIKTLKKINENNFLISYIPIVNKEICESHNLDYHKVILNEKNNKTSSNVGVFHDVSIIIASFVTAYARIYMHNIKLAILHAGGKIYYSDTDSIVSDLNLVRLKEVLDNKIGNKLGQLKLEYLLEEAYFISNKTYILLTYNGEMIKKAKGISPESLSLTDYKTMFYKSMSVFGEKTSSTISYDKGSVSIQSKQITINWDSFIKRDKIFDPKTSIWLDTRPLYIDTLTKSITIYRPLNLIKYEKQY